MSSVDFVHANAEFLPDGYKYPFLFKRIYLGNLYPQFCMRVVRMASAMADQSSQYYAEFGYRNRTQQRAMRQAFLAGKGGKAAPEGLSAHQYGLAVDWTADLDPATGGLQPTWDPAKYDVLGAEAAKEGLIWGASFGDRPHVQWPGFVSGSELLVLSKLWLQCEGPDEGRLRATWQYLDALAESKA